jgi:hypothetical protein
VLSVISVDDDDASMGATTNNLLAPAKVLSAMLAASRLGMLTEI